MEFRFNLNEVFGHPVVEIGNTMIPPGFKGDKRALWDTQSKVTQIVNAMGEASAQAQGLSKPITTADRLRNSEHRLYLLIDQSANSGKGAVTGMLKTGEKGLYVFDREGQHYQVTPPCVLDFYIHESRQRSGFGKKLFEHMLQKEQIDPARMAIDRPSDKFLGFLNKHYGLNTPVKQMNNYVVFDGFFPRTSETSRPAVVDTEKSFTPGKKQSANGLQQFASPYGRYAAPRPPCSMGQIIHNDTAVIKRNQEPSGVRSEPITSLQGQPGYFYGNQPAWQTTQSVPNMANQYPYYPAMPQYAAGFQNIPQSVDQGNIYHPYVTGQGDASGQLLNQQNYQFNREYQSQQYYQPPKPKAKEPLIPQAFDGSVRRPVQVVQSLPAHVLRQNQPINPLQHTMSTPFNYIQGQVYNVPSIPLNQQFNPNEPLSQGASQMIVEQPKEEISQAQQSLQNPIQNEYQQVTSTAQASQNQQLIDLGTMNQHQYAPPVVNQNIIVPQQAEYQAVPNNNQQSEHLQPVVSHHQQNVGNVQPVGDQQVPSRHQQNVDNPQPFEDQPHQTQMSKSQPHQQELSHNQSPVVGLHQQNFNTPQSVGDQPQEIEVTRNQHHQQELSHHQQSVSQNQQNFGSSQPREIQMTRSQYHGEVPNRNENLQPAVSHHQQVGPQPVLNQQLSDHQQMPIDLQQVMSNTHQPMGNHHQMSGSVLGVGNEENLMTRQAPDVDLSKGYPPQHLETAISARPPIIIRN